MCTYFEIDNNESTILNSVTWNGIICFYITSRLVHSCVTDRQDDWEVIPMGQSASACNIKMLYCISTDLYNYQILSVPLAVVLLYCLENCSHSQMVVLQSACLPAT